MKVKKAKKSYTEVESKLTEASDFDSRWEQEFGKYANKPLSVEEFDALTKRMLEFE